jgi:hypothetical protein
LLGLALTSGCVRPRALDIEVVLPDAVEAGVERILVEGYEGSCGGRFVFSRSIRRDDDPASVLLGAGSYCIVAHALDGDCLTIARGRAETTLPAEDGGALVVTLEPLAPAECAIDCEHDTCGPDADASIPDSGTDAACTPRFELSNCLDDDCDGLVDEGLAPPASDVTMCGPDRELCLGGANAFPECTDCECHLTCNPGYQNCTDEDGCETPLDDPTACGRCGNACPPDAPDCQVVAGSYECRCNCPDGHACCEGESGCVDTMTTLAHCGGCGEACPDPSDPALHASSFTCVGGRCVPTCVGLWLDCDDSTPGCDAQPYLVTSCGGCGGEDCTATALGINATAWQCTSEMRCERVCTLHHLDCDPDVAGCETPSGADPNCQSCGDDCRTRSPPQICHPVDGCVHP